MSAQQDELLGCPSVMRLSAALALTPTRSQLGCLVLPSLQTRSLMGPLALAASTTLPFCSTCTKQTGQLTEVQPGNWSSAASQHLNTGYLEEALPRTATGDCPCLIHEMPPVLWSQLPWHLAGS